MLGFHMNLFYESSLWKESVLALICTCLCDVVSTSASEAEAAAVLCMVLLVRHAEEHIPIVLCLCERLMM